VTPVLRAEPTPRPVSAPEPAPTRRALLSLLAALVVAVLGLTACTSGTDGAQAGGPASPGTLAEQWFAARDEAERQGVENLVSFYDPHVRFDYRALGPAVIEDREAVLEYLHSTWSRDARQRTWVGPLYVSVDGALAVQRMDWRAAGGAQDVAIITGMGATGVTSEVAAPSVMAWRSANASDTRAVGVSELAMAYASAWATGTGTGMDIDRVYAKSAELVDALAGVRALGRSQIADLIAAGGGGGRAAPGHMTELPELGGPAVFLAGQYWKRGEPIERLVMILAPEQAGSCPGEVAVVLELGPRGRVVSEQRYHRAQDLSRCAMNMTPVDAWWTTLDVPDPVPQVLTGTLQVGGQDVQVFNGTPQLEELIRWGFDRFAEAGLDPPRVSRVTSYNGWSDVCEGIHGLTLDDAIVVCFAGTSSWCADGCPQWCPLARRIMLHELGHAWMADHVDQSVIAEFLRVSGKPTWADRGVAWGERGVELAAETISWALMDDPAVFAAGLESFTCAEHAALFETLTGRRPGPSAVCVEPGSANGDPSGSGHDPSGSGHDPSGNGHGGAGRGGA
jgi:hypothetical protein